MKMPSIKDKGRRGFQVSDLSQGPAVGRGHRTVKPERLLNQMRQVLRSRHYSRNTEETYCHWVMRFMCFHNKRHPAGG